jgi:hypothetical protein
LGIGNVIGNNSSSHVEIKFSVFQNQIILTESGTEYQRNPNFTAYSTRAFSPHPDASFPELEHLIGHQAELKRLLELYDYAARNNKGAFVFITGQMGYGIKALGRAFVDAVREGKGRAALTRFWSEENETRSRRDVRWNLGFQRWAEKYEFAPSFLKQEQMFPFWGLYFQLCERLPWLENEPLPSRAEELPAFFRNCTTAGEPLVLMLEDFEHASAEWHKLLQYLAAEVGRSLPILWIIAAHADRPTIKIPADELTFVQRLAVDLVEQGIAEIHHLTRAARDEVASYIYPAEGDVVERLHRLTDGVPLLVQNLWQDWRRAGTVLINDHETWTMNKESRWVDYGSGRDYVYDMLKQLWVEDEAPWSAEQMYKMLVLAAQEGPVFTVEALARAFDIEPEILSQELEYLIDEPDDPGLIKEAAPVILKLKSANWEKRLERFEFSPLLAWFALTSYDTPGREGLIRYAEALRDAAHPFVERFSNLLAGLYERAGLQNEAKQYRQLVMENDKMRKLMRHTEFLLELPKTELTCSRLYENLLELRNNDVYGTHPLWVHNYVAAALKLFTDLDLKYFLGMTLGLLAHSNFYLGEYASARGHYERQLALEEELGRKDGVAAALNGLGHVADALGEYASARGYYERQLALGEELGRKAGVAAALNGLGDVAHALGEYASARGYYERQLALAEEIGLPDIKDIKKKLELLDKTDGGKNEP